VTIFQICSLSPYQQLHFKNVFMALVWDDFKICKVQEEKSPRTELSIYHPITIYCISLWVFQRISHIGFNDTISIPTVYQISIFLLIFFPQDLKDIACTNASFQDEGLGLSSTWDVMENFKTWKLSKQRCPRESVN
jgi:hypothetical protein